MRVIVFAFGAESQIIKMYAMIGIPRTRTCASLHLGSFFAIELIMIWLKCYGSSLSLARQNNRRKRFGYQEFLRAFALFSTTSFLTIAVGGTVYNLMAKPDFTYASMLVHWACVGVMLQPLVYDGSSASRSYLTLLEFTLYLVVLTCAISSGMIYAIVDNRASFRDFDSHMLLRDLFSRLEKKDPGI